jgi:putative restriction endonuclease
MERVIWTREEFMLVMNLYTKIPYGQFNARNTEVIKLANLINRTPGAVAYKLVHFSGLDPYHKNRGIKGLANPGNNAIKIYNEFQENWSEMIYESEILLAKLQKQNINDIHNENTTPFDKDILIGKIGEDKNALTKIRVNQSVFRKVIVNNYFQSCAICGLNIPELLIASHILKWSENKEERLNPTNGICLCGIHDKAFELGYIGINTDYKILISKKLEKIKDNETHTALFKRHENSSILLPDKYFPNVNFLESHLSKVFNK